MELKSALKLATVLWGTTEGNRCTILEAAALIRADREAHEAEFKAKLARVMVEVCEFGEILREFDMGIYPNAAVKKEVCG